VGGLLLAATLAATAFAAAAGYGLARLAPPLSPEPLELRALPGVLYRRIVRRGLRPQVVHLVHVDLNTPGLELVTTPVQGSGELLARTTTEFVEDLQVALAINGDAFEPWYSRTPWDYYPHSGDTVRPLGRYGHAGVLYPAQRPLPPRPTLFIAADGRPSLDPVSGPIRSALSGLSRVVRAGRVVPAPRYRSTARHPRTAIGLDRARRTLILMVADGRQRGYATGLTEDEVASEMLRAGAHSAINLDGGGSSVLVLRDARGRARRLSSPIHTRVPGRERPVANHLGVRFVLPEGQREAPSSATLPPSLF